MAKRSHNHPHNKPDDVKFREHKSSHHKPESHHQTRSSHFAHLDDHNPGQTNHRQFLDDLPNPKPNRYHPRELSYLLQQNAKRRKSSQLSATVIHTLLGSVPRCESESEVHELMSFWLPVLDEIFFFGKVKPHLTGGVRVFHKPHKNIKGQYDPIKAKIEINTVLWDDRAKRAEYQFIDTLLHEMLHAFFTIFTCERKRCCYRKMRKDPDWGYKGDGHGSAWCNAMIKIQENFEEMVRWHVDCGMALSVMAEMQDERLAWQPTEEQLRRWGLWGETAMNPMFDEETSFIRAEWPSEDSDDGVTEQWDSESENSDDVENDLDSEEDHRVHHHRHEVSEQMVLCSVM